MRRQVVLTNVAGALSARVEVGFVPWLDLRASFTCERTLRSAFPNSPGRFEINLLRGRTGRVRRALGVAASAACACAGGAAGALSTQGHEDARLAALSDTKPWFALDGSFGSPGRAATLAGTGGRRGIGGAPGYAAHRRFGGGFERAAGERKLTNGRRSWSELGRFSGFSRALPASVTKHFRPRTRALLQGKP